MMNSSKDEITSGGAGQNPRRARTRSKGQSMVNSSFVMMAQQLNQSNQQPLHSGGVLTDPSVTLPGHGRKTPTSGGVGAATGGHHLRQSLNIADLNGMRANNGTSSPQVIIN